MPAKSRVVAQDRKPDDEGAADSAQHVHDLKRQLAQRTAELQQALEHQTATAEVLQVIGSSVSDPGPVFEKIIDSCERLFAVDDVSIFLVGDDCLVRTAAWRGSIGAAVDHTDVTPLARSRTGQVIRERCVLHVPDAAALVALEPGLQPMIDRIGNVSIMYAPMLWEQGGIGSIGVVRRPPRPFSDKEIALLKTFADQAAIAIQNARMFNETKEALEQQRASADILSVISSSLADTQPVFDKILHSIEHLFGGEMRVIFLAGDDGLLHIAANHGPHAEKTRGLFPVPLEGTASELAMRERRLVSYADVFNGSDVPEGLRHNAHRFGENYSMAVAPMLWEDRAIGSILVETGCGPTGDVPPLFHQVA